MISLRSIDGGLTVWITCHDQLTQLRLGLRRGVALQTTQTLPIPIHQNSTNSNESERSDIGSGGAGAGGGCGEGDDYFMGDDQLLFSSLVCFRFLFHFSEKNIPPRVRKLLHDTQCGGKLLQR